MKALSVFLSGVLILVVLMASKPQQQTFDKISVREFELVDKNGKERASILVEENGEVVFRLKDKSGTIRLKMGADEDGSGLVLLDNNTEPGIHALAKKSGSMISVLGKDGKKRKL
jgi:hypothetical protein